MSVRFLTACLSPAALLLGGFLAPAVSAASVPAGGCASPASLNPDEQMFQQAQQAERAGDIRKAIQLYEELARKTTDHSLSISCYNRGQWLREGYRGPAAPAAQAPARYDQHKLEQAQKTYHKAEHCRRQGKTAQAGHYYEEVQHLVPGSIYDHRAANRLRRLHANLRRLQDTQVVVEIRMITMSEALLERSGLDFATNKKSEPQVAPGPCPVTQNTSGACPAATSDLVFLNHSQLFSLLKMAQGDGHTNCLLAPTLTMPNGQRSQFAVQDQQYFVTGLKVSTNGQVVFVPENRAFTTGVQFSVQPVVSADRKFVRVNLKASKTDLATPYVPLIPVTTFIKPEGGAKGQPVPFTQYIQQPEFTTLALDRTVEIPDGGTVVMGNWKTLREVRREGPDECPAVLSKIPYINRMFKNVGYSREAERVLVMVTPRIIVNREEEVAQVPPKAANHPSPVTRAVYQEPEHIPYFAPPSEDTSTTPVSGKVAKLLKEYQQACFQGRYSAATQLAVQALAIDPACFSKNTKVKKSFQCGE